MQRALLQFARPEYAERVREALRACGREDLIGFGKDCLVRPKAKKSELNLRTAGEQRGTKKKTAGMKDRKKSGRIKGGRHVDSRNKIK